MPRLANIAIDGGMPCNNPIWRSRWEAGELTRFVLAGTAQSLASELCSRGRWVKQAASASDALRLLQRSPEPQLLVLSEWFPGAGDVLAAIDTTAALSRSTLVAIVGG